VLYGYDEATDALITVYKVGDDTSGIAATRIPLGDRLSGWVAATGQTVINSDARLDLDETAREGSTLRSALAVAVTAKARPAGVLSFYATSANAFDEAQRRLVEAASRAIAMSVVDLLRYPPPRESEHQSSQNSTPALQK